MASAQPTPRPDGSVASGPNSEVRFGFGTVWHHRSRPSRHEFTYRAFFVAVPAPLLFGPASGNWLFGINRPAIISVSQDGHGLATGEPLKSTVTQLFESDAVTLYCFASVLGYQFKPVSFWVSEQQVLAEVHNTFGERHAYLLSNSLPKSAAKTFHVSPFCDVKGRYEFDIQALSERFSASIDYHDLDSAPALIKTRLSGRLVPVTVSTSLQAIFAYPFFSLGVIAGIHWQALRLWMKKVPWFSKPTPPLDALSHATDFTAKND
jgi:uncharacterized protein